MVPFFIHKVSGTSHNFTSIRRDSYQYPGGFAVSGVRAASVARMPSDAERLAGVGVAVAAVGLTTAASFYASRPGPKRWTRWLFVGGAAAAYGAYSLATWLEDQKNEAARGGDVRDALETREKETHPGAVSSADVPSSSDEIRVADPEPPARRSQMDQLLDAVADGYDDDIDAAFDRAVESMTSTDLGLTNDQKLRVYALFKQATRGRCDQPKPRLLDGFARHAKWTAWNELGDTSRDDAKEAYVELVAELQRRRGRSGRGTEADEDGEGDDGEGEDGEGDALGGPGGPAFSRPRMPFAGDADAGVPRGCRGGAESIGAMDPLLEACRRGDVERRGRAANFGPLDLRLADECGRTALHWAADGGHVEVAMALIKMGADVDAADDDGQTALHYAATCERAEMCRLLLESGADPDAEDADGDTPNALGAVGLAMRSPGAD